MIALGPFYFLDKNKLAEDTLVIYMGDNGFSFGEHGLIDKRHFYEESAKVPLLVRWPTRLKGGAPINALIQNIDIAPTILDVAGLRAPAHMQGMSIVPLLERTPQTGETAFSTSITGKWTFLRRQRCLV